MNSHELREQLLELESYSPDLQARYRKEMKNFLEKPLGRGGRVAWILAMLMGLSFFVIFGIAAIKAPREFPLLGRIIFIAGAVFGAAWAVLAFIIAKRGSMNRKTHVNMVLGMTFGFMVIMMTLFMMQGVGMEDSVKGLKMVLYGLVFFVMFGIPSLMAMYLNCAELGIREHMLKLELQIAELAEKQAQERSGSGSSHPT